MSLASRVMVVGHPKPNEIHFGALCAGNLTQAKKLLANLKPAVIVFGQQSKFEDFCDFLREKCPEARWVLSTEGLRPAQLMKWINEGSVAHTIQSLTDSLLEQAVQKTLEEIDNQGQQEQLVKLLSEQTKNLQALSTELEARVQKRQRQILKSQKQLQETNSTLEVVHKALLAIYRAKSVTELERSLNEVLNAPLHLQWIRILFSQQSSLGMQNLENSLMIEIPLPDTTGIAKFVLLKAHGQNFSNAESDLLSELSEAIGLALQRIHKLDMAETLKQQWEATFDSISHPLCLTNGKFKILRMNHAFAKEAKGSYRDLVGKNCFEAILGRKLHPENGPFQVREVSLQSEPHQFEISGQPLEFEWEAEKALLVLFRDVTEEHKLERRILESTKLAELGTIGSSIAHELNNPLGGMLSFLQLIKMDLPKASPLFEDIVEMEKSTLNCRDIVRNLLSFARKNESEEQSTVELKQVVDRAVKLVELQSRSKGIDIHLTLPESELPILGSFNNLSQALCNLLQNSVDAISDKMQANPLFPGRIEVEIQENDSLYMIRVNDNGSGISPENQTQIFNPLFTTRDPGLFSGMGLTTAFSIISEHKGNLEITSQSGSGTTAIISLTRLDLHS